MPVSENRNHKCTKYTVTHWLTTQDKDKGKFGNKNHENNLKKIRKKKGEQKKKITKIAKKRK